MQRLELKKWIASAIVSSLPALTGCTAYGNYVIPATGGSCEQSCRSLQGQSLGDSLTIAEIDDCIDGTSIQPDGGTSSVAVCRVVIHGYPGGRRPAGLESPACLAAMSAAGAHLAAATFLEAASVHAFRHLRRELAAHRAPASLLRAAAIAARDEARHAAVCARWRDALGGAPIAVRVAPLATRGLEDLAAENEAEGCVRETWGALLAGVQSTRAGHPALRRDLAQIAHDEIGHAALSFRVSRWAANRMPSRARARLRDVRKETFSALRNALVRDDVPSPAERDAHTFLGLPPADVASRLLDLTESALLA